MSRSRKTDIQINKSIDLAKKSKRLVPRIKNWCSNIVIHSEYGGVIGQMGFPTMNTISCSQARGDSAMNLEWISNDFIIENCPGCKYHKEVVPNNFGREVLKNREEFLAQQRKKEEEEAKIMSMLETLIQEKLSNNAENNKTTELSILRKLIKLKNPNTMHSKISLEILEASKISPSFFNSLSNDYLCLFFDKSEYGQYLIEASANIVKHDDNIVSDFFIEKVIEFLKTEQNLNGLIRSIPFFRLSKSKASLVCTTLIERYDPDSFSRYDHFENHSPDILQFIFSFYDKYYSELHELLENGLKNDFGRTRAFSALIVHHLFENDKKLKFEKFGKMLLSLDLEDYDNYPSPDFIITKVVANFHRKFPHEIKNVLKKNKKLLRTGGKIELIRIYEDILKNADKESQDDFLDELISIGFNSKEQELRKKAIEALEKVSRTNGVFLLDKIDAVIGLLADSIKNKITFEWYKKNLDDNTVTFNPLRGQSIDSILLDENLLSFEIDKLKEISQNLLKADETRIYTNLIKIIRNTDEKSDKEIRLKKRLIEIIRDGVKDASLLIGMLPDIYTWLLDFRNPSLRVSALKVVEKLLKKNHQIVPKTIHQLLEIFLQDQDNLVKKYTILCIKQVIRINKELEVEVLETLLDFYKNKYVIIHKTAADITYDLYERLDEAQKLKLLRNLFHLFLAYNNEDYLEREFRKRMFKQVMFVSNEINPKHKEVTEPTFIKTYLSNYCTKGDYYSRLESLKDLAVFKNQNIEYEDVWLKNSLLFLKQFQPHRLQGFWDSDRYALYKDFSKLNQKTILDQIESLKIQVKEFMNRDFDLYSFEFLYILSILSSFNLYEDSEELIRFTENIVDRTKSTEYFFNRLDVFKKITLASIAIHVENDLQKFVDVTKNFEGKDEDFIKVQFELFSKRIILFYDFDIKDLKSVLKEKDYLTTRYEQLVEISYDTAENDFFNTLSLICKGTILLLEWGNAVLEGELKQQVKLNAAKSNMSLVESNITFSIPSLEKRIQNIVGTINEIEEFDKGKFIDLVKSFGKLNIPIIYHLTHNNKVFQDYSYSEPDKKNEEINLVSIELYISGVPWANPQIVKPKEIYNIEGKVRINTIPLGYEYLNIIPASTNTEIYDLQLSEIKLTNDIEYNISGNILFKYPLSDLDQIISIKLVPFYERADLKLYPSVVGYDELIGKVVDESNELFQTGFNMMNKKVFEFYQNPIIRQLEKSEIKDFFRLLNALVNYQGFCLQNGVYKKVKSLLENKFRDNLIQHLIANPTIGGEVNKETEISGGKVEIQYRGFIVELKVENKLSDRRKIIEKYDAQAQSYASGSSKLGSIICVLDLTEKKQPPGPAINNIHLHQPKIHGFENVELVHKPFQIFIFIDGNTRNPSEYSK